PPHSHLLSYTTLLRSDHQRLIVGDDDGRIRADVHRARRGRVEHTLGDLLEPVCAADDRIAGLTAAVQPDHSHEYGHEHACEPHTDRKSTRLNSSHQII